MENIIISHPTFDDLDAILKIYEGARKFMKETDNPNQWKDSHPLLEMIEDDIRNKNNYLIKRGDEILGVFALLEGPDETYHYIEGEWLNDEPYYVIHRIASSYKEKGILKLASDFAFSKTNNLRIDTHEENKVMRHLLEKNGFKQCGVIYLKNGDPRIAYHKIVKK